MTPHENESDRLDWFNVSSPFIRTPLGLLRFWNLFNRRAEGGHHWWGVGLLQIGNRHLAYVGHSGVSLLFIWRTARDRHRRVSLRPVVGSGAASSSGEGR